MSKTKKTSFMSNTLRLVLITVIAGLLLSIVYTATCEPIQTAQNTATIAVYRKVFPDAADLKENPDNDKLIAADTASLTKQDFGDVMVDKVVGAVDTSGNVIGHIINAGSKDGYGGLVLTPVGIQSNNKTVNGIAFLTIAESAGLGMGARGTDQYRQFNGKKGEKFTVTKADDGELDNDEVSAISGATITSHAVTNSVNATFYFVNNSSSQ